MANESTDPPIPNLSRTHLHVLQILWDADESLKPSEIEERFQWPIENATLRSVLKILMEKGEIQREKQGKAYLYFPKKNKKNALSELFAGLAEVFTGGSRAGLVAQLLQDEKLSDEEIEELKKITAKGSTK